jgi:hypothetical protein
MEKEVAVTYSEVKEFARSSGTTEAAVGGVIAVFTRFKWLCVRLVLYL